ncbi:HEAT repeat domain-containing protein [Cellulophaga tyrosinoxydans]|uniref:HEAT repeat-containing protein n=1 Tax=Cellulophaga tyrosinoxydans TaxID=504486 RepID=A0A1W2C0A3_9FLAO|nr:HEAT repeat domain-containing protein [Cellulophaga tyrosinoxydans]SMC78580.1 hypothetical protein SAMN05660703_2737 [Cellulophaga tyrosinoxydans]
MNLIELTNKFKVLVQKPSKTKQELELQQELGNRIEKALNEELEPLIYELKKLGLNVSSIWDLVNSKKKYSNAIDILINHLNKAYSDKNKEGIVRALAVKEATGKANEFLFDEYDKTPKEKSMLRWTIGNTIQSIATTKDIDRILSIVQNKENGTSRQMFVLTLGKLKSTKGEDILIKLLDDDEVNLHALKALSKIKSPKAINKINELTKHPNTIIKKEALLVLKKILN